MQSPKHTLVADSSARNHSEKWIEGKLNKDFLHFLPYLMIFQSGVHDMHDPLPRCKREAKVAIGVILDPLLAISF